MAAVLKQFERTWPTLSLRTCEQKSIKAFDCYCGYTHTNIFLSLKVREYCVFRSLIQLFYWHRTYQNYVKLELLNLKTVDKIKQIWHNVIIRVRCKCYSYIKGLFVNHQNEPLNFYWLNNCMMTLLTYMSRAILGICTIYLGTTLCFLLLGVLLRLRGGGLLGRSFSFSLSFSFSSLKKMKW